MSLPEIRSVSMSIIPHNEHRYPTVGDWIYNEKTGHLEVLVSNTGIWQEAFCVGLHEIVEAGLFVARGGNPDDVDAFDTAYEEGREESDEGLTDEPGDEPSAPYYYEHQIATNIERQLCFEFGMDWEQYNDSLSELG